MTLRIDRHLDLAGIPSASGLEATSGGFFVIGDDAAWLYRLDASYRVAERIRISAAVPDPSTGRIPKAVKPDFEALASRSDDRGLELFVFGSGSRAVTRDGFVRVRIGPPHRVSRHDLSVSYAMIQRAAARHGARLNIEAAVIQEDVLYLFDRARNVVARCAFDALLAHLESGAPCPVPTIHAVRLPRLERREAGFSGATLAPDGASIIFTASVEHSTDAIADGAVAGSLVGQLALPLGIGTATPACDVLREPDGQLLRVKVESVAVRGALTHRDHALLLVTDSDDGRSGLLEATFTVT